MVANRRIAMLAVTVCVGLALGGCGKKKGGGTAASYTARAKIEAIDGRELTLRHEAIPNFVNAFGDKVTMDSMAMPFAAGEGVAIDGLAVGDLVEVRFHTDWDKSPTLRIDAISKLPAGTKLAI